MVPSLLMAAGTFAASAESTDDFCVTVWVPPDEPPPQAVPRATTENTTVVTAARRVLRILAALQDIGRSGRHLARPGGFAAPSLCQDSGTPGDPRAKLRA